MRKKILNLLAVISFLSSTLIYSPKSEAVVGLIVKNRVVKTMGGIAIAGGLLGGTVGVSSGINVGGLAGAASIGISLSFGAALAGIGLIILEENVASSFEFTHLSYSLGKSFTKDEIDIYNNELEYANAIVRTIESEICSECSSEDANLLWEEYKVVLSPETIKIIEESAVNFFNNIK